jgi:pimeloyl-ACP methyl ester carboxylesterase
MLAGEYNWSTTPALLQQTADQIRSAQHKSAPELGHFPATENPGQFVPYLIKTVEFIQKMRSKSLSTMRLGNGTD